MKYLTMLDWSDLAINGLWIAGLAWVLAVCSVSSYEAQEVGLRLRHMLRMPRQQVAITLGLSLCSLGMLLLSPRWWERALWCILLLLLLSRALWLRLRADHSDPGDGADQG